MLVPSTARGGSERRAVGLPPRDEFKLIFRFGVKAVGVNLAWRTLPIAVDPNAKELATNCESPFIIR